jgi:hypothetical protein
VASHAITASIKNVLTPGFGGIIITVQFVTDNFTLHAAKSELNGILKEQGAMLGSVTTFHESRSCNESPQDGVRFVALLPFQCTL